MGMLGNCFSETILNVPNIGAIEAMAVMSAIKYNVKLTDAYLERINNQ